MKSRDAALKLKRFEAQEKVRKVEGIELMIRDLEVLAVDLERQIMAEEDRTGCKDQAHFSYSTFAKAAHQRRDKLKASIDDLRLKLDEAVQERDEAMADAVADAQVEPRDPSRGRRRLHRPAMAMAR